MKRIILLLIFLIIPTGCYDYNELNDLALVSGLGIDYENEQYLITYEILQENTETEKAYIVTGVGPTLSEAIQDITLQIEKIPYLKHIEVIILGENLARNKLQETIDFLIRQPKINNDFYTVIAKEETANIILENHFKNCASRKIVQMLDNNLNKFNYSIRDRFEDTLQKILEYGIEPVIVAIGENNNTLQLQGLGLIKDYSLQEFINTKETVSYNVLTNEVKNAIYTEYCQDKTTAITINSSKTKKSIKDNNLNINVSLIGKTTENNCKIANIEDTFTTIIEKELTEFIDYTRKIKIDSLGIGQLYYKAYRTKPKSWYGIKYNLTVNLHIDNNDLVNEESYDN